MKPNQQFAIHKRNTWAHVIAVAAVVLTMLVLPGVMAANVVQK